MTEQEVAEAVQGWVDAVIPELAVSYPYLTAEKGQLPDAMIDVEHKRLARGNEDDRFAGWRQLQQTQLRVFDVSINFMVEHSGGGDDAAETEQLRDFGSRLDTSLVADASLGGALGQTVFCPPTADFAYELPFVQYADGTRGRQMTATILVAELIQDVDL